MKGDVSVYDILIETTMQMPARQCIDLEEEKQALKRWQRECHALQLQNTDAHGVDK